MERWTIILGLIFHSPTKISSQSSKILTVPNKLPTIISNFQTDGLSQATVRVVAKLITIITTVEDNLKP
jgi:hypothetical protein